MFSQGRVRVLALAMADMLCIVSAWAVVIVVYWSIGVFLRSHGWPTCPWGGYDPVEYLRFLPVALVFVVVNAALCLYHGNWTYPSVPLGPVEEFRRLCIASFLSHFGVVAYIAFAYQTTDERISRAVCLYSCFLTAVAAQSFRNWVRFALHRLGIGQIPAVLAGAGHVAHRVVAELDGNPYVGIRIVGYFAGTDRIGRRRRRSVWSGGDFDSRGIPYLGTLRDIVPQSRKRDVKILFACQDDRLFRAQMDEFAAWFTYIDYLPAAKAFPIFGARAVSFGGLGGLEMVNQGRMRVLRWEKHIIDFVLAAIGFAFALPLFAVIPILIKLTSKGPVFYRQERLGLLGRPFRIWKFRTMYADADERLERLLATNPRLRAEFDENFKIRNDPRVTPLGRFLRRMSLDEIPQIFNVFAGQMSFVGPRPIVAAEVPYYGEDYDTFSRVRPGVTGLWQCSGRSDTGYDRRVALDIYYALNWSPWMDIWICIRTVFSVLLMRGAA